MGRYCTLLLTVCVLCFGWRAPFAAVAAPPDSVTASTPRVVLDLLHRSDSALNSRADYITATSLAIQAWKLAKNSGTPTPCYGEWRALDLLTDIAYTRNHTAEAINYARQALDVAKAFGYEPALVDSYTELGNALSEDGQWREADKWLRLSRAGLHHLSDTAGESHALVNLAWNELYQDRLSTARAYAEEAVKVARQKSAKLPICNALDARANVLARLGLGDAAVADIEQALHLALVSKKTKNVLFVRNSMSTIYEKAGRFPEALAAERRYTSLNDSLSSVDVEHQINELTTRFRVGQQQARITTLTQQQRISTLSADRARSRARLSSAVAVALAALLLVGGWLLQQVRRSRAKLAVSEADLRRANATKDELMRIIGHDLRAPLATFQQIAPVIAQLADAPDPAEQHTIAVDLADHARTVSALVDNLLDWSRAQTGQIVAYPQPVQLATEATNLRRMFGPVATSQGIRLVMEIADNLPTSYSTDPNLLAAILRNLLGNALKFTPSGGTITFGMMCDASAVTLTIADTGTGMPPDKLASALAGTAVSSTSGTNGEVGTGLGLAVCRHFAGLLGAEWRGESTLGVGTRWTLLLPNRQL